MSSRNPWVEFKRTIRISAEETLKADAASSRLPMQSIKSIRHGSLISKRMQITCTVLPLRTTQM